MKSDPQLEALFRAARAGEPAAAGGDFGFETRLLARLREERGSSWMAIAMRLSPFFAALVVAAAVWCRSATQLEPDASYALDAMRSGGSSALIAWWPESEP